MSNYAISLKRTSLLLAALAFTAVLLFTNLGIFGLQQVSAAELTTRSLSLSSTLAGTQTTGAAGSETNGSAAIHTFVFTVPTAGNIGSVLFKYCTTASGTCTAPTGMSASGSGLTSESFAAGTFVNVTTGLSTADAECVGTGGRTNCTGINNASPVSETATSVTVIFNTMQNPDVTPGFFVRMEVYSGAGFTTEVHQGVVASAITNGIAITTRVAETLGFSTTGLINTTGIPPETGACVPLTGTGAIVLGQSPDNTLSLSQTYDTYSAFRLYTNATTGAIVQYEGNTLTKGADNIDAVGATAVAPVTGTEQFGMAVDLTRDNANANLANADSTEGGVNQLDIDAQYDGGNGTPGAGTFAFVGTGVKTQFGAFSTGAIVCDTYAVQYMANISTTTPAGVYSTTVVYFAVPTF